MLQILLALVVVCDEMVDAPLQPVFERLRSGFGGFQHSRSLFDVSIVNDNGEVIDLAAADAVQLRLGQRKQRFWLSLLSRCVVLGS